MRRHTQHLANARPSRTSPRCGFGADRTWSRISGILCIVIVALGACIQACHVHDGGRPGLSKTSQSSQQNGPGNTPTSPPDHCLLCVAMHAAMPVAQGVAPVPIRQVQAAVLVALLPRRMHRFSFDMFSRPPPSTLEQANSAGQIRERSAL